VLDREGEARALLGLGKVWNLRGRHDEVLGIAERALAGGQGLPLEVRVRSCRPRPRRISTWASSPPRSRCSTRCAPLLAAAPDADLPGADLVVPTVHNLAIAYAAQGRYREASAEFRAALAQVRGAASPRAPLYLSNLATLLLEVGEWGEARSAAEEGLAAAQRFGNRMHETMCHEALAEVLAHAGDLDGALASLRRAEELNAGLRMDIVAADLLALRGRIFCARGQYRRAVEFMTRALEHLETRPDAPRRTSFLTQLAWCELRAGRPHVARDRLAREVPAVDQGENDDQRMRVHYWLAEAQLALGEPAKDAAHHLAVALERVRVRGYEHFLRVQAREEPAPLVFALERGIEVDACAGALVEAGSSSRSRARAARRRAGRDRGGRALGARRDRRLRARSSGSPPWRSRGGRSRRRCARRSSTSRSGSSAAARPRRPRPRRAAVRRGWSCSGPPRVEVDGRPVPASAWRTQRAFHMLVHLALHPKGATREVLLETFWPGRQAAAGRRNFHPTLSYLRALLPKLEQPALARDAETYRLNPGFSWSCDLWSSTRSTRRRAWRPVIPRRARRRSSVRSRSPTAAARGRLRRVGRGDAGAHQGPRRDGMARARPAARLRRWTTRVRSPRSAAPPSWMNTASPRGSRSSRCWCAWATAAPRSSRPSACASCCTRTWASIPCPRPRRRS
jgi:tetratricopeptide (TPR) repeat protein